MQRNKTTFLKDHFQKIEQAINEAFKGSEESLLHGEVLKICYSEDDCTDYVKKEDFTRFDIYDYAPRHAGPGIYVIVKFNKETILPFHYPEKLCPDLATFIDDINTDFCMKQLTHGEDTQYLEICGYDLSQDTIITKLPGQGKNYEAHKGLRQCLNLDTLVFNVSEFEKIKRAVLTRSTNLFFTPIIQKPTTYQLHGIDKNAFLSSITPKANSL